ncbi:type I secretion system permease/ATPase [Otariodibacter sp.]|uniref:type I secretion system permease/ATPase n=1 Tax=Otariodibacter sp. TaxID=3030919 RepID=UPI002634FD51|nr:type I secretion system permease/ATPase [Otariodibacter sp.]
MKIIIENLSLATQFLGSQLSVATLISHTIRKSNTQIDFGSLVEFLKSEGFDNVILQRSLNDIPTLSVPVILFQKNEEAALVTEIKINEEGSREYKIIQIGNLQQWIKEEDLEKNYLGYCWFIKPKNSKDVRSELPEYNLPKAWFFRVIWRFKKYYYQVIFASFIVNFLALVSSLYVMNVYDRVIPNKAYQTLWVLSIGVILAITFELIAKMLRAHLLDIAGKKTDLIISSAIFRRVMSIKLKERPASSGSYANNLREFESVRDFMTSATLLTLVDLPFLLLFISVMWIVAGKLALVPLSIIPIVIIVSFFAQIPFSRYINESMREASQRQGLAVEAIEGMETLKTNNAVNWAQKRWDFYTAKTAASSIKVKNIGTFITSFTTAMQQLNTVFLILVGTYLIHSDNPSNKITMGALIATVILSGRALGPLGQIANLANRFQQAKLALQGINSIVERPIERDSNRNYITIDKINGKLVFDKVSFSYEDDGNPILDNLSLVINPGEKVGILGKIGSGKSTSLKLASGIYEPQKGNITLDGVDMRQIDPHFLRNQVLLLEQNPRLFLGTLRENLDLARMDGFSSDHELLKALERFDLLDMIRHHPKGLDMPLGENGLGLSGGQKQILSLARMTMKDPKIVLLDEPTTGLDQYSEIQALKGIAEWAKNKTMLVVTHRPQVLKIVDRVIVFDSGKVVISGPRDAVLQYLKDQENGKKASQTNDANDSKKQ